MEDKDRRTCRSLSFSTRHRTPPYYGAYSGVVLPLMLAAFRVNVCIKPSRKAKNTSTAYPTRKARARGEREAPCVMLKLLNKPTTAPPIAAIKNRAEFASEGMNVRLLICCSKLRRRYAHVPKSAYSTGRMHEPIAP